MDTALEKAFEKMGARVQTRRLEADRRFISRGRLGVGPFGGVRLDVRRDEDGEYFDISFGQNSQAEVSVLNISPKDRHLLLLTKEPDPERKNNFVKGKFLCGHDERHWFVAAIPEEAAATTVRAAREALKPLAVTRREAQTGLSQKKKSSRRNVAWKRQGEWFFVPVNIDPLRSLILKNEPFFRSGPNGNGKPHQAQFAYRSGGEAIYVSSRDGRRLSIKEYGKLDPDKKVGYRLMTLGANMFVKGRITHPDHATLELDGWHEVQMNTEARSSAMKTMVFLD